MYQSEMSQLHSSFTLVPIYSHRSIYLRTARINLVDQDLRFPKRLADAQRELHGGL